MGTANNSKMGCGDSKDDKETKKSASLSNDQAKPGPKPADTNQQNQQQAPPPPQQQAPPPPPANLKPLAAAQENKPAAIIEKFPNETLISKLYDTTTATCGKYLMPGHFSAHMAELGFASTTDLEKPSSGKEAERAAFVAAGDFQSDGVFNKPAFMKYFELRNQVVVADADVLRALIDDGGTISYHHVGSALRASIETELEKGK